MIVDIPSEKILLKTFFEFYELIAEVKRVLQSEDPQAMLPAQMRSAETVDYATLAAFISRKLEIFLNNCSVDIAASRTDFEIRIFKQAMYVMAVLADEIFILDFSWPGSEYWPNHMLENRLFCSQSSGNIFFSNLGELLKDRSGEALIKELANLYLIALQLGFAGKYRGQSGLPYLKGYQKKLLTFVGASPKPVSLIFKKSYDYCLSEAVPARLAPFAPWIRWALFLLLLYLLLSGHIWYSSIDELWSSIQPVPMDRAP